MKVFARLFQKAAQSRARSPCRLRRGEIHFPAFLFCLAFFFALSTSKKKAENNLDERYGCRKGNALTKPSSAGKVSDAAHTCALYDRRSSRTTDEEITISDRKPSANKTPFQNLMGFSSSVNHDNRKRLYSAQVRRDCHLPRWGRLTMIN